MRQRERRMHNPRIEPSRGLRRTRNATNEPNCGKIGQIMLILWNGRSEHPQRNAPNEPSRSDQTRRTNPAAPSGRRRNDQTKPQIERLGKIFRIGGPVDLCDISDLCRTNRGGPGCMRLVRRLAIGGDETRRTNPSCGSFEHQLHGGMLASRKGLSFAPRPGLEDPLRYLQLVLPLGGRFLARPVDEELDQPDPRPDSLVADLLSSHDLDEGPGVLGERPRGRERRVHRDERHPKSVHRGFLTPGQRSILGNGSRRVVLVVDTPRRIEATTMPVRGSAEPARIRVRHAPLATRRATPLTARRGCGTPDEVQLSGLSRPAPARLEAPCSSPVWCGPRHGTQLCVRR